MDNSTLTLSSESASDFSTARQRAFIEEWRNFFTGRPSDLLSFEEVKHNLRLQDSAYKGLQEIELDKIVGSMGRYRDFTRSFLPKNDQTEERWRRVDAVANNQGYPPIDVYQVGDVYFVRDGNHRVSVARMHKVKTIEAYVTEYKTSVPIDKDDAPDDIIMKMERTKFFEKTHLDEIRPEQNIEFTAPGRYRRVRGHIAFHKHVKEVECGCEIPYNEAVASWYDNVYMPVVTLIRKNNILRDFTGRTEADLYAWLITHRARLEEQTGAMGYVPDQELVEAFKRERATNPFARLMGLFRSKLNLKSLPLKIEQEKFMEETGLFKIKPNHGIRFTEPGCYQLTKEHIDIHKYYKEVSSGKEITYAEAVTSWYDNVYSPTIQLIRERQIQKQFPKNTEGDLYVWLISRRKTLEEETEAVGQIPTEKIIWDLENEMASTSILKLSQFFGRKLDLQSVIDNQR